ncbi:MAG TPA: 50S ribosomal protein L11 methyltransferase [Spirochaetota bacterium]|nr:50S ribosomal protein L11 methyltransferase [Spirochaetota bacterium]HPL17255.1 50S ribosomal protein L11 methyltransferase [Spirochaetota bacterium]HRS77755.1 50S ribosomal protein L11 methyltransferase [Spirochaetota bacterium]HRT75816.1 50S ribosomal protein L11 methyltransferase [Spirochaetota bacterium]
MLDQIVINIISTGGENEEEGPVRYHTPPQDYLRQIFSVDGMTPAVPLMPLFNDDSPDVEAIEIAEKTERQAIGAREAYPLTVTIDPGHSFGDGRHATTWLCVKYLVERLAGIQREGRAGLSLLDAGTGTGVLAITAAKLGIRDIDAIDIYHHAVRCAESNRALNDCGWIRLHVSDIGAFDRGRTYDIVMANLVSDVIIANLEALIRLTRPGGTIIASGVSAGRHDDVRNRFGESGLELVGHTERDGWHGFFLRRAR